MATQAMLYELGLQAFVVGNYNKAGQFILIPPQNASYRFKVSAPFGKETLWVIAGDIPIVELHGELLGNGLKRLHEGVPAIKKQIAADPRSSFAETHLSIFTKAAD